MTFVYYDSYEGYILTSLFHKYNCKEKHSMIRNGRKHIAHDYSLQQIPYLLFNKEMVSREMSFSR